MSLLTQPLCLLLRALGCFRAQRAIVEDDAPIRRHRWPAGCQLVLCRAGNDFIENTGHQRAGKIRSKTPGQSKSGVRKLSVTFRAELSPFPLRPALESAAAFVRDPSDRPRPPASF